MKCLVIGCICLWALASLGCKDHTVLDNVPTELHRKIPGTRISIIPPVGFWLSRSFVGFAHDTSESAIKVEFWDGPFAFWDSIGIDENYINKYMDPVAKAKVTVNGLDGYWTESSVEDSREGKALQYALYFGDEYSTIILSATCDPPCSESLAEALKTALQTMVYDPQGELDMEEAMPFEIALDNTSFYLQRASPRSLHYVEEAITEEDVQDSSTHEITAFRFQVPLKKRQDFVMDEYSALNDFQSMEVTSLPAIEVDSLQAFPVIIEGMDGIQGDSANVYQLWLFSVEGYYVLNAKTKGHFAENLKLFQQIGATFDVK
jgi:hypothetical protein